MVHQIKYGGKQKFGVRAGERLAGRMAPYLEGMDFAVPMPVHRARKRERGYNQALRIAQGFCRRSGIALRTDVLARIRSGTSQTSFDRRVRSENIKGNFSVRKAADLPLGGKSVLLIDDVMTTGATSSECAGVLKAAGAARVGIVTLARVLPSPVEEPSVLRST
jgi:ComF family protein